MTSVMLRDLSREYSPAGAVHRRNCRSAVAPAMCRSAERGMFQFAFSPSGPGRTGRTWLLGASKYNTGLAEDFGMAASADRTSTPPQTPMRSVQAWLNVHQLPSRIRGLQQPGSKKRQMAYPHTRRSGGIRDGETLSSPTPSPTMAPIVRRSSIADQETSGMAPAGAQLPDRGGTIFVPPTTIAEFRRPHQWIVSSRPSDAPPTIEPPAQVDPGSIGPAQAQIFFFRCPRPPTCPRSHGIFVALGGTGGTSRNPPRQPLRRLTAVNRPRSNGREVTITRLPVAHLRRGLMTSGPRPVSAEAPVHCLYLNATAVNLVRARIRLSNIVSGPAKNLFGTKPEKPRVVCRGWWTENGLSFRLLH